MRPTWRHWAVLLAIAGLILAVDQTTKQLIETRLAPGETIMPIGALSDYFRLTHSQNTGAAFGLLPQFGDVISVIAVGMSIAMLVAHGRMASDQWGKRVAMGMVIGGALGNVIDRVRVGHVIDFINYRIPGVISNVSNLADHAIVLGVIVLLILTWRTADEAAEPTSE
ncbi:MAG: signal peptidase II [Chloroflexi bacterium]|nr:signal peptidase II [Chloroflexota bacterium]